MSAVTVPSASIPARGIGGPRDPAVSSTVDCNLPLGRLGTLETRLAAGQDEVHAAQALRYEIFCREMGALPGSGYGLTGRDVDAWDDASDHLLVVEKESGADRIVGTCRLIRQDRLRSRNMTFYSQSEFDIDPLLARHPGLNFMEIGRSCVLPGWRTRRTVELLWHGIWSCVLASRVDAMIGCASFPGRDPGQFCEALTFLARHAAADCDWSVAAQPGRGVTMDPAPDREIDRRAALAAMPPLIKGYLRLGAWFAPEAVIDPDFATTDVLVILPVDRLNQRYVRHYGDDASRHAAIG